MSSQNPISTPPLTSSSLPSAQTSLFHPPRSYILRTLTQTVLPIIMFSISLITATTVFIYSVVKQEAIPSKFIVGIYITMGIIVGIWCFLKFVFVCALRLRFGDLGMDDAEMGVRGGRGRRGRERGKMMVAIRARSGNARFSVRERRESERDVELSDSPPNSAIEEEGQNLRLGEEADEERDPGHGPRHTSQDSQIPQVQVTSPTPPELTDEPARLSTSQNRSGHPSFERNMQVAEKGVEERNSDHTHRDSRGSHTPRPQLRSPSPTLSTREPDGESTPQSHISRLSSNSLPQVCPALQALNRASTSRKPVPPISQDTPNQRGGITNTKIPSSRDRLRVQDPSPPSPRTSQTATHIETDDGSRDKTSQAFHSTQSSTPQDTNPTSTPQRRLDRSLERPLSSLPPLSANASPATILTHLQVPLQRSRSPRRNDISRPRLRPRTQMHDPHPQSEMPENNENNPLSSAHVSSSPTSTYKQGQDSAYPTFSRAPNGQYYDRNRNRNRNRNQNQSRNQTHNRAQTQNMNESQPLSNSPRQSNSRPQSNPQPNSHSHSQIHPQARFHPHSNFHSRPQSNSYSHPQPHSSPMPTHTPNP